MEKKRIVVLGGGFAGVYTAIHLEKLFGRKSEYEIVLVSRDNYFTYQPMLSEIIGGSLGVYDTLSSLRSLLKHTKIYVREIVEIDIADQSVILSPNFNHKNLYLKYDYLVFGLGNVTDFRNSPGGLHEHAFPFKNLSNALTLRNHLVDVIETAAIEEDPELKKQLLTFIVGGGGFSGVEAVAEINDFARSMASQYDSIDPKSIRVMMVHRKERLMNKELSESLSRYAEKILRKRGVEFLFNDELVSATPMEAFLASGEKIATSTIVSTVPCTPNPLVETLPFELCSGRIKTDETLKVLNSPNVWALGDCAAVPLGKDSFCPPTAQFAVRQAKRAAKNIYATIHNRPSQPFQFKQIGMMAALGHRRAVGELFGTIKLSGIFAWFVWRFVYLWKLPSLKRKFKVAVTWLLEVIAPGDAVQLKVQPIYGMSHLHYAEGEVIFNKGDVGDYLYVVVEGEVGIVTEKDGIEKQIATIKKGEFFGEMALLNQKFRTAKAYCQTSCDIVAIRKQDFNILVTSFGDLKAHFEETEQARLQEQIDQFRRKKEQIDAGNNDLKAS
ncbi:MAG: hypothetical protein S4CHLAM102_00020 [Chlamydiia bacterium]|nr:hypothetical protein [Chlamydiia bacterium]